MMMNLKNILIDIDENEEIWNDDDNDIEMLLNDNDDDDDDEHSEYLDNMNDDDDYNNNHHFFDHNLKVNHDDHIDDNLKKIFFDVHHL